MYVLRRLRRDGRLPPPAHPPLVRGAPGRARDARDPRLDDGAGRGDPLGRRPPQAPHVHRRGGRPAQPPHPRAARAGAACSRGWWHAHTGWLFERGRARPRRAASRPTCARTRSIRWVDRYFLVLGRCSAWRSRSPPGFALSGGDADRRPHRAGVGRPRADLPPAPRDLERQLDLPHVRHAAVRHRRREPQQLGRRARVARRGLAPQPPRLPDVGPPRPAAAAVRPVLRDHPPLERVGLARDVRRPSAAGPRAQAPRRGRGPGARAGAPRPERARRRRGGTSARRGEAGRMLRPVLGISEKDLERRLLRKGVGALEAARRCCRTAGARRWSASSCTASPAALVCELCRPRGRRRASWPPSGWPTASAATPSGCASAPPPERGPRAAAAASGTRLPPAVDPVTVSVTIDRPREEVFDYLADIANHAEFTDHYLVDWRLTREDTVRRRRRRALPGQGAAQPLPWADVTIVEVERAAADRRGRAHRQVQPHPHARRLRRSSAAAGGATRVTFTIETEPADAVRPAHGVPRRPRAGSSASSARRCAGCARSSRRAASRGARATIAGGPRKPATGFRLPGCRFRAAMRPPRPRSPARRRPARRRRRSAPAATSSDEVNASAETEGIYLDVGELKYQVQISRQLNPDRPRGPRATSSASRPRSASSRPTRLVRVFIRVENDRARTRRPAAERLRDPRHPGERLPADRARAGQRLRLPAAARSRPSGRPRARLARRARTRSRARCCSSSSPRLPRQPPAGARDRDRRSRRRRRRVDLDV